MTHSPKTLVVLLFLLSVSTSNAFAQRPFERLQKGWDDVRPRGKILRELFGDEDDQREKQKAREERLRDLMQRSKQSDNENRNGSNAQGNNRAPRPTPAVNAPHNRLPSSAAPVTRQEKHPENLEWVITESNNPAGLVVEKISSSGAAWHAGIRRGDLLVSIGGLKMATRDDVAGIVNILKAGDQIEFEVVRRGNKQQFEVQFGELPRNSVGDRYPPVERPGSLGSVLNQGPTSGDANAPSGSARWQVQPPSANQPPRSGQELPAPRRGYQPADGELTRLRIQLEQKQREVEQLKRRIREAQNSPGDLDLDSFPDISDR